MPWLRRLRLAIFGYQQECEPPLVQHGRLWQPREGAPSPSQNGRSPRRFARIVTVDDINKELTPLRSLHTAATK
jgi:hypothetical protein